MDERTPDDVMSWSPNHVKLYLEKHLEQSRYDEDDIKKLWDLEINRKYFLHLAEEKLININRPFAFKSNTLQTSSKFLTITDFEKYRESIKAEIEKLNKKQAFIQFLYPLVSLSKSDAFVIATDFKKAVKDIY
ncbi:hypothetical protein C1646_669666 [Rhizophagus diaphanus]|nr:hypothetical protein C1646_669666 [Rhizophagus diaphanus] [Rhizophagus sp. MUCL 43196]